MLHSPFHKITLSKLYFLGLLSNLISNWPNTQILTSRHHAAAHHQGLRSFAESGVGRDEELALPEVIDQVAGLDDKHGAPDGVQKGAVDLHVGVGNG